VDLENLSGEAVLPVGGMRASVPGSAFTTSTRPSRRVAGGEEVVAKMTAKYPDLGNPYTLWLAAYTQSYVD
jgi:hypothetical protein